MTTKKRAVVLVIGYNRYMFDIEHADEVCDAITLIKSNSVEVDYNNVPNNNSMEMSMQFIDCPNVEEALYDKVEKLTDRCNKLDLQKYEQDKQVRALQEKLAQYVSAEE